MILVLQHHEVPTSWKSHLPYLGAACGIPGGARAGTREHASLFLLAHASLFPLAGELHVHSPSDLVPESPMNFISGYVLRLVKLANASIVVEKNPEYRLQSAVGTDLLCNSMILDGMSQASRRYVGEVLKPALVETSILSVAGATDLKLGATSIALSHHAQILGRRPRSNDGVAGLEEQGLVDFHNGSSLDEGADAAMEK